MPFPLFRAQHAACLISDRDALVPLGWEMLLIVHTSHHTLLHCTPADQTDHVVGRDLHTHTFSHGLHHCTFCHGMAMPFAICSLYFIQKYILTTCSLSLVRLWIKIPPLLSHNFPNPVQLPLLSLSSLLLLLSLSLFTHSIP